MSTFAAAVLFTGVLAYAVLGGADYGAGFWDLTAGDAEHGRRPRHLVDESLAPVWEANHVWLVFCLVMLWTGFPAAFAAIMTTLYIPLGLAALGIVVRGSGFAFRKVFVQTDQQRVAGAAFAISSVLAPFFLGTVVGGIASGRVPSAGHGDPIAAWVNPTSVLGGVLAVLVCAFVAAVFLTAEARRRDERELEVWFRRRSQLTAVVTGAVALAGIAVLHADAPRLFDGLLTRGLPLVLVSAACGLAALALLRRAAPRVVQALAVLAAATIIAGWGTAQYPYLLGTHLAIGEAAAPAPTLVALIVVAALAVVLVVPSMGLLFVLAQRGTLQGH
jgi:cytochrome bd ubiquinol oxidase subunit II